MQRKCEVRADMDGILRGLRHNISFISVRQIKYEKINGLLKVWKPLKKIPLYLLAWNIEICLYFKNQFSPNNIHILSIRKVTRINRIITKLITLIFKHILSTTFSKKCMEARQENLYVDLGAERVKVLLRHPSHTITPFGWSNLISVPFFQSSYRKNQFSSFCTQNFLFKECWRISPTGETTFNLTFPIF